MFPTSCATTASLSEPARVGDRHTMPARSPSVVIPARAIGLPGIMFASLGISPTGHLGPDPYYPPPKLHTYPWIKFPLHFYGTSGLLPLIDLFLSLLLTPTTRTLSPCGQHCSMLLIIQKLLKPLTGQDNSPLCHYFSYYLTWIYDNEVFMIGDTLTCSYGGLGEKTSDLHSLRAVRRRLMAASPDSHLRAQAWTAVHDGIYSHLW